MSSRPDAKPWRAAVGKGMLRNVPLLTLCRHIVRFSFLLARKMLFPLTRHFFQYVRNPEILSVGVCMYVKRAGVFFCKCINMLIKRSGNSFPFLPMTCCQPAYYRSPPSWQPIARSVMTGHPPVICMVFSSRKSFCEEFSFFSAVDEVL